MEIKTADYSNLINAVSTKNAYDYERTARQADYKETLQLSIANGVINFANALTDRAVKAIESRDTSAANSFLENASKELDTLGLDIAVNGKYSIARDDNGNVSFSIDPSFEDWKTSQIDAINGMSWLPEVKKAAIAKIESMHGTKNSSLLSIVGDEAVKQLNQFVNSELDTFMPLDAEAIFSGTAGENPYASGLEYINSLPNITDLERQTMEIGYKNAVDAEVRSKQVYSIASTDGVKAAHDYIDSLPIGKEERSNLRTQAVKDSAQSDSNFIESVNRMVTEALDNGESWVSIRNKKDEMGLSAYQKELFDKTVTAAQESKVLGLSAPYLAKVQSGTLSVDELEDVKQTLEQNKDMFTGLDGTYETYMGIVDKAIEQRKAKDELEGKQSENDTYANATKLGQQIYDKYRLGNMTADEAIDAIRAIGDENSDSYDIVHAMDSFVMSIVSDKNATIQNYVSMKLKDFSSLYSVQASYLGSDQMKLDYIENYESLYKDLSAFVEGRDDLSTDDIDTFMAQEKYNFFARYADAQAKANDEAQAQYEAEQKAIAEQQAAQAVATAQRTDIRNSLSLYESNYNSGMVSKADALAYFKNIAETFVNSDSDLAKEAMEKYEKISSSQVPTSWSATYKGLTGQFEGRYLTSIGKKQLSDIKGTTDYETFVKNQMFFETALADYISNNPWASLTAVNEEADRLYATFNASYATEENSFIWGADDVGSKVNSFLSNLKTYEDTVPFQASYNFSSGSFEYNWVNQNAKDNWDNLGRYGLQTLQSAGFNVGSFGTLELGAEAYPQMVFYSEDMKDRYTLEIYRDEKGDLQAQTCVVAIKNLGGRQMLSMIPADANTMSAYRNEQKAVAEGAVIEGNRNAKFDTSSIGDIDYYPTEAKKSDVRSIIKGDKPEVDNNYMPPSGAFIPNSNAQTVVPNLHLKRTEGQFSSALFEREQEQYDEALKPYHKEMASKVVELEKQGMNHDEAMDKVIDEYIKRING